MNRTEELVYWITEREAMRVAKERKEAGLPWVQKKYGWSNDIRMGSVRYCNVRREDDKVTRWLAQHWRPQHHAVWEIVLARMVNYIPTLERIVGLDIPRAEAEMKMLRRLGDKIWTSAYTISTCGASMDKVDYVMGVVQAVRDAEEKWDKVPAALAHFGMENPNTLAGMHKRLTTINGLGSFLAAQVVADLKNTAGHRLQSAEDWHTWAAHGPGSLRGLSDYFNKPVTPKQFSDSLSTCWNETRPHLPPALQDLHMQDFQNCMCEFSKFMRFSRGGHVRNKYVAA